MSTIPLPLVDGNTLIIDNSSMEVFTTCPRAAEYSICHRRKSNSDSAALRFGGIIHKALDVRYRAATSMHAQSPEVEAVMLAVLNKEFEAWTPAEDEFRNHSFAVELIHRYGHQYPFESFEVARFPDGKPCVEIPFALPLGSLEINEDMWVRDVATGEISLRYIGTLNVVWTGKIDLVYRYNGGLYIMDHKTTSMMGPSFFQDFELAHQMHGYSWAVETILGQPVAGYVINALATRKPTKTGKSMEFERKAYQLSRSHLQEWQSDALHIVSDFIEMVRRGYLPKHTKWCCGKYGTCQFHKVCTLSPEQRPLMLHSGEFVENTWSPLNES